ncbi:unnamed protein product [Caenorhabditis brenneri]
MRQKYPHQRGNTGNQSGGGGQPGFLNNTGDRQYSHHNGNRRNNTNNNYNHNYQHYQQNSGKMTAQHSHNGSYSEMQPAQPPNAYYPQQNSGYGYSNGNGFPQQQQMLYAPQQQNYHQGPPNPRPGTYYQPPHNSYVGQSPAPQHMGHNGQGYQQHHMTAQQQIPPPQFAPYNSIPNQYQEQPGYSMQQMGHSNQQNGYQMQSNPYSVPQNQFLNTHQQPNNYQQNTGFNQQSSPHSAVFFNSALIESNGGGQFYTNADGYTEYYPSNMATGQNGAAFHTGEPVTTKKFEEIQPQRNSKPKQPNHPQKMSNQKEADLRTQVQQPIGTSDSISTMSSVALDQVRTPSSDESDHQNQEKHDCQTPLVESPAEPLDVTNNTDQASSENNGKPVQVEENSELKPAITNFKFNGANFPKVSNQESSKTLEQYKNLMGNVEKLIKDFIASNPHTSSSTIPRKHAIEKTSVSQQGPVPPAHLQIDYLPPHKPLVVRCGDRHSFEASLDELNAARTVVNAPGTFEKFIPDPKSTMTLHDDHVGVQLSQIEQEQVEALIRSARNVTIIMHAEFSEDVDPTNRSFDSNDGPASPDNSGAGPSTSTPRRPNQSDSTTGRGDGQNHSRPSRRTDFPNQGGTSNRGRSTSNYPYTVHMNAYQRWHELNREETSIPNFSEEPSSPDPLPIFDVPDERRPGPSRRLPEIPIQYRNGDDSSVHLTPPTPAGNRGNDECSPPQVEPIRRTPRRRLPDIHRRRHQSHESAIRSEPFRRYIWSHEPMRFIVPKQRSPLGNIPYPPYNLPLIGVARRVQDPNYVPQRILPGHQAPTELRQLADNEDLNSVRGTGPLMLEPYGFWYPSDVEFLETKYQEEQARKRVQGEPSSSAQAGNCYNHSEAGPSDRYQEGVMHFEDELCSQFESQSLSGKEKERRKRQAAQNCQLQASIRNYKRDSDDDEDDNTESYSYSGVSSSCSKFAPSDCYPSSSAGSSSNYQSSSSNTRHTEKPVKDTSHRNQKRREKELQRVQRKEEEKVREEIIRLKKEKKLAKLQAAEEKRKMEEEELAAKKAAEEQKRKEEEEQKVLQKQVIKAEKKKLINQNNKEKKKRSKQNKFEAAKVAEEEKRDREIQIQMEVNKAAMKIEQRNEDAILSALLKAKYQLLDHKNEGVQRRLRPQISKEDERRLRENMQPVLQELCDYENLDMRSIRERSEKIDLFFELDPRFQKDSRSQLTQNEEGRFKMTAGICLSRELENMRLFDETLNLKHARAVRQYRYWQENMYEELSLFVNYTVGIDEPGSHDPTIELFEEWAVYRNDNPERHTMETVL